MVKYVHSSDKVEMGSLCFQWFFKSLLFQPISNCDGEDSSMVYKCGVVGSLKYGTRNYRVILDGYQHRYRVIDKRYAC